MGRPVLGKYFDDILPVDGKPFAKAADSTTKDVELALDAAHQAKDAWAKTSLTKRVDILLKIADRLEANLELLAVAETWENDKPIRETFVQYRQDAFG
jgi:aldehyde dehydrogenase